MPESFKDLDQAELYRSAIEDFAVNVEATDNEETIRAALLESGVTWAQYVEQHPEVAPVDLAPNVVKSGDVGGNKDAATNVALPVATPPRPTLAEAPKFDQSQTYLVKMERENPFFQFGQYKFTKDNPFQVMDAVSTNRILVEERGFSIATPADAQEYYGL